MRRRQQGKGCDFLLSISSFDSDPPGLYCNSDALTIRNMARIKIIASLAIRLFQYSGPKLPILRRHTSCYDNETSYVRAPIMPDGEYHIVSPNAWRENHVTGKDREGGDPSAVLWQTPPRLCLGIVKRVTNAGTRRPTERLSSRRRDKPLP